MNPFDMLCNDTIYIHHQDGRVTGPHKSALSKDKFTVFDATLDVTEGDLIERPLPNGKAERYDIIHVHFSKGLLDIPPSYDFQVHKQGSLVHFHKPSVTNISVSNSQGIQIGDYNTQNIVDSLKVVIEQINKGPGSLEEKKEAKSRLLAFIEHPLTAAVIGGAVGGLAGLLK
jgi:hypothetical protein